MQVSINWLFCLLTNLSLKVIWYLLSFTSKRWIWLFCIAIIATTNLAFFAANGPQNFPIFGSENVTALMINPVTLFWKLVKYYFPVSFISIFPYVFVIFGSAPKIKMQKRFLCFISKMSYRDYCTTRGKTASKSPYSSIFTLWLWETKKRNGASQHMCMLRVSMMTCLQKLDLIT